jgi:phosphatidylglycerol---prolipoprotein diacylglyceryl transferase
LYPRLFQFGHFAIPTYGAFTALALVAALVVLPNFAQRLSLGANKLWNLGLIGILTTLIAARLLLVAAHLSAFRRHPFWVLGLAVNRSAWIFFIAALLGFAAAALYALAEGLPILRVLDCAAPAAALGLVLNRIGAFLAGLDYGIPAAHAWGVTYTSRIAAVWYHTPIDVKLYPVQLYEAVASLAVFGLLTWWLPRRTQDGELAGSWLLLVGVAGYFFDFFRATSQHQLFLHQTIFALMVATSPAFLLRRKLPGYTVENDAPRI